jgi:hypothetical protein
MLLEIGKFVKGGIAVIYKKELNNVLKFDIKKDSQFVLWFQLSKLVLKLDSDLVFGCVYIPLKIRNILAQTLLMKQKMS